MSHSISRRTALGGTLGAAAGLGLATRFAPAASAAVARPAIIGCATWGAAAARQAISMVGPPTTIVIHHTASPNVTDYSQAAGYSIARQIQQWHFDRGWIDSGQHFTVSRGGYVLEGRHRTLEGLDGGARRFPLGAHSLSQNSTALGIENQGSYTSAVPTTSQWNALVGLCAYLCQTYALGTAAIQGHRQFEATACPGDAFNAKLPQLRSDVAARLGGDPGGGDPGPRTWPLVSPGASGFRVTAAQYLLRDAGYTVTADGSYDSTMTPQVKAFQASKGLVDDGKIGRLTWESPLAVTRREGQSGEAVRAVQTCLNAKGSALTVDGIFGSGTRGRVQAFQASKGLVDDGVVGLDTWSRLLA